MVWKFYRETAKVSGNNTLNWGTFPDIANNGIETCKTIDLDMCNANLKGILFENIGISQILAFNMYTKEFIISDYSLNLYTLSYSTSWDTRTSYYGNVFQWKGTNHRYTLGSGDYLYLQTSPGGVSLGSGGNLDTNHWRATFIR